MKRPEAISQASLDRRGRLDRLVLAAEIVVHEVDASARCRFSAFLLKPFVSRVNRRIDIRIVRLLRSTYAVEIWSGSGTP